MLRFNERVVDASEVGLGGEPLNVRPHGRAVRGPDFFRLNLDAFMCFHVLKPRDIHGGQIQFIRVSDVQEEQFKFAV